MKLLSRILVVGFLVVILMLHSSYAHEVEFFSPSYFEVSNNEFDPIRFLNYEPIIFKICPENGDVTSMGSTLSCDGSNQVDDIELHFNSRANCYYGFVEEVTCENSQLDISYTKNSNDFLYSRELIQVQESTVVQEVLSTDVSRINDALELSHYLIVHNMILGENSKSQEIFEEIRDLRDNANKCWPRGNCNVETSISILLNLHKAGYGFETRLLQDGLLYLDSTVRNATINNARVQVSYILDSTPDDDITCELRIDDDSVFSSNFNSNNTPSSRSFETKFSIECTDIVDTMNITITDPDLGDVNEIIEGEDSFTFIRSSDALCFGRNNCDLLSTLKAVVLFEDRLEYYDGLNRFIQSYKFNRSTNQQFIRSSSDTTFSSMYLHLDDIDEIGNFVKFRQNNDGSWGSGRDDGRIFETYWATRGLSFIDNSQDYIRDAENWMYFNEPPRGWGNIERNTLAYLVIERYIRPFIVLENYNQILTQDSTEMTVRNPSMFRISNLEVEVDSNIESFVSFTRNLRSLDPSRSIDFNMSTRGNVLTDQKGMMRITGIVNGQRQEFVSVPILVQANENIKIRSELVQFNRASSNLEVEIESLIPELEISCRGTNSFNDQGRDITLSRDVQTLVFRNDDFQTGDMNVNLRCQFEGDRIEISKTIQVEEQEPTFRVDYETNSEFIIEDFDNTQITIISNSNDEQEMRIEFDDLFLGIVDISSESFLLRPNDRRVIRFDSNGNDDFLQSLSNSTDRIRIISSSGYVEEIHFTYVHNPQTNILQIIYIIVGVLGLLLVALIVIRFIQMRKEQFDNSNDSGEFYEDHDEMLDLDDLDFK